MQQPAWTARLRAALTGVPLVVLSICAGCDIDDPRARTDLSSPSPASGVVEQHSLDDRASSTNALTVRARFTGVSRDASEADLSIAWTIDPVARAALRTRSTLIVRLAGANTLPRVLFRHRVSPDTLSGIIEVSVPVDASTDELTFEVEGLAEEFAHAQALRAAVDLPSLLMPTVTDLSSLHALHVTLQPGSYTSVLRQGRRQHRFTVRVEGILGDGRQRSVSGLDTVASRHFQILESGYDDPESPVTAVWRTEPITVYLIMDVSSSIVLAGAADQLLDVVSRTLLSLAPVARFDYRSFAGEVHRLQSLRDLAFDDVVGSGTALHRALDTALDDIERDEPVDTLIVLFTDGRDLASRNFYPGLRSLDQVHEHVLDRLRTVADSRRRPGGARFQTHVVSLGSDIDTGVLRALAEAGGGRWFDSHDAGTLNDAFSSLSDGVRGVYRLQYSSQQVPNDTELSLQVRAAELSAAPLVLPTGRRPSSVN